jgi:outer membrane biogenesis lipoprotein LolB
VGWNASKAGSVVNDPNSWEQRIHHSNLNRLEKLELIHFLRSGQNYSHEQESNHGEFDWIKLSKQAGISLSKPLSQQWHEAMFLDLETQSLIFI